MIKKAIVTGITGQDGAYLAKLLIEKGYRVFGTHRRSSNGNYWRLASLGILDEIELISMELLEFNNIVKVFDQIGPDEVYNLAAQSHVGVSFEQPIYTAEADGLGVTRLLEVIKQYHSKTRFYQASTSEMFGKVQAIPQTEKTPFYPRSPYAAAKLYAHWMCINYREAFGIYAVSGILFNHESPYRGTEFVTRKITAGLANIKYGHQECIEIGNLEAQRDWGFAGDYVDGMWRMLQQEIPQDYVLATGRTVTVKEFIEQAASIAGMPVEWKGEGRHTVGYHQGKPIIKINERFYRPAEVDLLIGNPQKAKENLQWEPKVDFSGLVTMMMDADLQRSSQSCIFQ